MPNLSPHITLRKDEALYDKDPPFQRAKENMNNDDRKENIPTRDIPFSSNYPFDPFMCPYTKVFEQSHNEIPSLSQLKTSYEARYDIISKQIYRRQGLKKHEQGIKILVDLLTQFTKECLGYPNSQTSMEDARKVQILKDYFTRHRNYHPSKHASTSHNPPPSLPILFPQVNNPSSSTSTPCPTSQHTRPSHIDNQEKLATRIFWILKYDKHVMSPFIRYDNKNKQGDEYCLFHRSSSHSLENYKAFKEFVQDQYDRACIALTIGLAIFIGEEVRP